MWALVITGIFTMTFQGQTTQIDAENLRITMEMAGDITIAQVGYTTEQSCKLQLATLTGKHSVTVNGINITIHTAECKGEDSTKGKGPKA